jgi:anti-anti-sigma factor
MAVGNEPSWPCTTALSLVTSRDTTSATVSVAGELDLCCVDEFTDELATVLGEGFREVQLDLEHLAFCDASGLRAMLAADRWLRSGGGRLTITGASPIMRRLLEIVGMTYLLGDHA